jgi:MFS family permease
MVSSLFITINLFIEEFEDEEEIGATRGIFITLASIGTIISTLVAGSLIQNFGFEGVYIASAIVLSPVLFLLYNYYKNVPEPKYKRVDLRQGLQEIFDNENIYGVFVATFALQIFYVLMTIYSGIYLLQNGVTLQTFLTFIMPLALAPFILLPYQLGKIADNKFGEKEMLIGGMMLMGVICIIITFTNTSSPIFWAFILFLSRIGAATVEEMSNAYFYKKAKKTDSVLIGMFGSLYTLALVVAPIFASLIMIFFTLNFVFFFLGIFILLAIFPILKIIDTR